MQTRLLVILVILTAFISSKANASLIVDFDSTTGFNTVSNSNFSEDGFNFVFGNTSFIFEGGVGNSNFNGFNSPVLEVDGLSTFVITLTSGALFDFNSVLANQSGANPLSFVGVFADNSTVVNNVLASTAIIQDASVITFGGFTSIRELRISTNNSFALFDNFTFNASNVVPQVPAPTTLGLFIISLFGLTLRHLARR